MMKLRNTSVSNNSVEVAIASGASDSAAFELDAPRGIVVAKGGASTNWTASTMTVQVSDDGTTWYDMKRQDSDLTGNTALTFVFATTGNEALVLAGEAWGAGAWKYLKFAGSANQAAARTLIVKALS